MRTIRKTIKVSVPEREEEIVRALRTHLASAGSFREQGDLESANSEDGNAGEFLDHLTRRVAARFERYARAAFRDGPKDLIQDAVQEMFASLCLRVKDLTGKQKIWEDRFNFCLRRLEIDAVRTVRRRNGLDRQGLRKTPGGGAVVSLDEPRDLGDTGDAPLTVEEQAADPSSGDQFTLCDPFLQVLGPLVQTQLLTKLPQNQKSIFLDRMHGVSWDDTARRAGVSVSTAQHRFKEARATLLRLLSREP